jgi:hypothetical protein
MRNTSDSYEFSILNSIHGCYSLQDYAPIVKSDPFPYIPCVRAVYPICLCIVYKDPNLTWIIFRGNTNKTWYSFSVSLNELLLNRLSTKS